MSAAILNFIYFHFPRILFTNPLHCCWCLLSAHRVIHKKFSFSFSRHRFGIVVWSLSAWWLCVQYEYSMIQRGKNGLPDQTSKTKQLLNCTATPSVGSHRKLLTTIIFPLTRLLIFLQNNRFRAILKHDSFAEVSVICWLLFSIFFISLRHHALFLFIICTCHQ